MTHDKHIVSYKLYIVIIVILLLREFISVMSTKLLFRFRLNSIRSNFCCNLQNYISTVVKNLPAATPDWRTFDPYYALKEREIEIGLE